MSRKWSVLYSVVQDGRTVEKVAAASVDWKTALMIKRNHKRICKMTIKPAPATGEGSKSDG